MPPARESLAAPTPTNQLSAGATIGGRFRIEGPLFQDAVSQTYRAADLGQGAPVALRVLPLRLLGTHAAQLEADVEKASAIVHKNLVEVVMVGREADFYFIATELLDGQTLREFIDGKRAEGRGVSFRGACNLITHITNALERAATFMPHGGLTPASIWVNKAGRVKVADLGLLRTLPALARRGAPEGTPDTIYVAPEVIAGGPPSAAADVYSLGVLLYEVLTGRPPSAPLRPATEVATDAPPAIDDFIRHATSRAPEARFASPAEFRQALLGLGAAEQPVARTATPVVRAVTPSVPALMMAATPPPTATADGRITLGKSFDVAAAAGGAADDTQERWLIQKDKLDFGPFSLAQIRAQIERGEIMGEHMIVDGDTGARKKVKDYPALKEFTKVSERRLEQMRRAKAEHSHEATEKKKSMATMLIVGVALAAVGGGMALYLMSRKAADQGTLATREEEAEVDAFIKEAKIEFQSAHAVKRGAHHGAGGGDADFNNDMNLGDVSKTGGGTETLDDNAIQRVMMSNYRSLVPCIMAEKKHNPGLSSIDLEFVVKGSGKVSAVRVNGQRGGGLPSCVLGRMQSFSFPHFNGSKTIASWSMSMR
ncbi:MAG: Serine/threonine-protein kinase PknB [Myxococcales bacterium]|nr:Serine/threonine-protein kinase PknB [Myxococcales bacterium]